MTYPIRILVLNGPNLNLLGKRETDIYGRVTLADIEKRCEDKASHMGFEIEMRQSNNEGDLISWVQETAKGWSGLIINPAAFTHTSVAIMDALKIANCPIVEVHLSNIHRRETFRHHSYVSPVAEGVICGFGPAGYEYAIEALLQMLNGEKDG